MSKCSAYECDSAVHAKGLCSKHYMRDKRHQDLGVNFKFRYDRILINDQLTSPSPLVTCYELQALREIFFRGKHHGSLHINYNEATGFD